MRVFPAPSRPFFGSAGVLRRRTRSVGLAGALLSACLAAAGCPAPASTAPTTPAFETAQFAPDFAFGTALSQWQACGDLAADGQNVVDSNWRVWTERNKVELHAKNPMGSGFCQQFVDDIARAKALGLDTFRLGIDWSRIEPAPDQFDEAELDLLVDMLEAVRAADMEPVLTFYHWVVPTWVQNPVSGDGNVDMLRDPNSGIDAHFEDYVRHVLPRVAGLVDTYTVLNEPLSVIVVGYVDGRFPPGRVLDIEGATNVGLNMVKMHARAYDAIKELDTQDAVGGDGVTSFVGLTMTANDFLPIDADNRHQVFAAGSMSYVFNNWIMNALTTGAVDVNLDGDHEDTDTTPPEGIDPALKGRLDFVGVQYYGPVEVLDAPAFTSLHPLYGFPVQDVRQLPADDPEPKLPPHNGMGRRISASGFADTLDIYAEFGLPMIITENGTTRNDFPVLGEDPMTGEERLDALPLVEAQAATYLVEHLWELGKGIEEKGWDVRGYYHWSLTDNFEWQEGWLQRFGAYAVDETADGMPRTLSLMGEALRDVATARAVDQDVWEKWVAPYATDALGGGLTTSRDPMAPLTK